ncbi:hypothetical protein IHN32_12110 [Deinococcus sp. 14RED07]|nr:hypothetical protein [Deinococcus sp. RIT780]MCD0158668.1 hypothetical protein [Deinococcus sp. 6GRE01]MCD0176686.1 hypothetical protein [Deinococcus sp. 14RED07]
MPAPGSLRQAALRMLGWLLSTLLFGLTLLLALLALGTFASLAGTGPLWLRSLGGLESALAEQLGLEGLSGVGQALSLMILTSLCAALAAFVKPRA